MKSSPQFLLPAMWICWLVYWAVAARNAKATERRESAASRASHHVPLILGAALLSVPNIAGHALEQYFLPQTTALQWAGVACTAFGLGFSAFARAWLGRNWSSEVTVKQEHELIRGGPYALVRHPIYTGLLVALIGATLTVGRWRAIVGLAFMLAALVRKLAIEERFMAEQFGDAYARYRAEVPALIPFVV
jgi:protein-S-isoprenylcysteine O-methyltransferase Ste14